jgi:hypothetical protein
MEPLEAVVFHNPGEPIKAALRKGPIVVIALRLCPGAWHSPGQTPVRTRS